MEGLPVVVMGDRVLQEYETSFHIYQAGFMFIPLATPSLLT
jgi:hypothetical protein